MMRIFGVGNAILLAITILLMSLAGCGSGIEDSPAPGILRITLESNQTDTVIIIVKDTLTVSDGDNFRVSIFQGRVFQGNTYGILYPSLTSTSQQERAYNLIARENNLYMRFQIFETYLTPGGYSDIEFGIDSEFLKLQNFDRIDVITPPNYYLKLPVNFDIHENRITEVNVRVSPFTYIVRYRDSYNFEPEMDIVGVTYY